MSPTGSESQAPPQRGYRPRRGLLLLLVGVAVLTADVTTKMIAVAELAYQPPVRLLGGFLTLRHIRNSGAAFGLGENMTVVFTVVSIGVVVGICYAAWRVRSLPWAITLGLLLGGAAGNLGDRLFRAPGPFRGHVVDWIQLPYWPIFNIADSAIVCGGVIAVILAGRGVHLDGSRTDDVEEAASHSAGSGSPAEPEEPSDHDGSTGGERDVAGTRGTPEGTDPTETPDQQQ